MTPFIFISFMYTVSPDYEPLQKRMLKHGTKSTYKIKQTLKPTLHSIHIVFATDTE